MGGRDHSEDGDGLAVQGSREKLSTHSENICAALRDVSTVAMRRQQGWCRVWKTSTEYQFHDLAQDPKEGEGACTYTP